MSWIMKAKILDMKELSVFYAETKEYMNLVKISYKWEVRLA